MLKGNIMYEVNNLYNDTPSILTLKKPGNYIQLTTACEKILETRDCVSTQCIPGRDIVKA